MRWLWCWLLMGLAGCVHGYEIWRPDPPDEDGERWRALRRLCDDPADGDPHRLGAEGRFVEHYEALGSAAHLRPDPEVFRIRGVPAAGGPAPAELRRVALANDRKLRAWYGHEFAAIRDATAGTTAERIGLALSGGGIRSASFATGVLRGLHELGVLEQIGYVSTVSGGGWAGYWYLHRCREANRRGSEELGLPRRKLADALFAPASRHLSHLAQEGHYLTGTHYSKSAASLAGKVAMHFLAVPFHWLLNGPLDLDHNVPFFRDFYRDGLGGAFGYTREHEDDYQALRMSEYRPTARRRLPYWIINLHLSLEDDEGRHRNRTGDAFELTPHRAGADAVGYVHVRPAATWSSGWMTDLWGVAVSSAAVDSRSLQTGFFTSAALQVLNLDLGAYVDGWSGRWLDWRAVASEPYYYLTAPWPIYSWLGGVARWVGLGEWFDFGKSMHETTAEGRRYYLTDGGHFDNTGLYALVRRGCRLIVFSDATRDRVVNEWDTSDERTRALGFASFRAIESVLYADFGTEIEVDWRALDVSGRTSGPASGFGDLPGHAVVVGTIRNLPILAANGEPDAEVKIVILRAAYDIERRLRTTNTFVDAEKAENADFPNDSTAEQFYHERRIQAYRELGRVIARQAGPELERALQAVRARHGGP